MNMKNALLHGKLYIMLLYRQCYDVADYPAGAKNFAIRPRHRLEEPGKRLVEKDVKVFIERY